MLKRRLDALESGKKPHEGWIYSAPSISEEELEEIGYDEDGVEEMDTLLNQMKTTTKRGTTAVKGMNRYFATLR